MARRMKPRLFQGRSASLMVAFAPMLAPGTAEVAAIGAKLTAFCNGKSTPA